MPIKFNNIAKEDLRDNERLKTLYIEAVRRKFWPNNDRAALEFFCLAEKALHDDKQGTPGKLFHGLIKNKDTKHVSDAMEKAAILRLPSHDRYVLVGYAEQGQVTTQAIKPLNEESQHLLFGRDIGYSHSIMMQCFLPHTRLPDGQNKYTVEHGKARLRINAGEIADPENAMSFKECQVPFGAKARLIMPYINGYAVKHKTQTVDLGNSLRKFMAQIKMPASGPAGKVITQQVQNIAASEFILGLWDDEVTTTKYARVTDEISFWLEKDPNQKSIWQPEMVLSEKYLSELLRRPVPIDMNHLVQLKRSPRLMDIYTWFSYRLPMIPKGKEVPVSLRVMHQIFGRENNSRDSFVQKFKQDVIDVSSVHKFNVDIRKKVLWMRHTPSPVKPRVQIALS